MNTHLSPAFRSLKPCCATGQMVQYVKVRMAIAVCKPTVSLFVVAAIRSLPALSSSAALPSM